MHFLNAMKSNSNVRHLVASILTDLIDKHRFHEEQAKKMRQKFWKIERYGWDLSLISHLKGDSPGPYHPLTPICSTTMPVLEN